MYKRWVLRHILDSFSAGKWHVYRVRHEAGSLGTCIFHLTGRQVTLLHESLTELAELAPQCSDTPTVRGVLAESQDLVRNAIDHGERPQALVEWFSRLVTDVLHSEAIADMRVK